MLEQRAGPMAQFQATLELILFGRRGRRARELGDGGFFTSEGEAFISWKFMDSKAEDWIPVVNQSCHSQEIVYHLPLTNFAEVEAAMAAANMAYPKWQDTPVTSRQRVMLKFQKLIRLDIEKLARIITVEQGKTLADARADMFKGLEVVVE